MKKSTTPAAPKQPRLDLTPQTEPALDLLVEAYRNAENVTNAMRTRGATMAAVAVLDQATRRLARVLAAEDQALAAGVAHE